MSCVQIGGHFVQWEDDEIICIKSQDVASCVRAAGEIEAFPEQMFVPAYPVPNHLVHAMPSSEKCHKVLPQELCM